MMLVVMQAPAVGFNMLQGRTINIAARLQLVTTANSMKLVTPRYLRLPSKDDEFKLESIVGFRI